MPIKVGYDQLIFGGATEVPDNNVSNNDFSYYISAGSLFAKFRDALGVLHTVEVGKLQESQSFTLFPLASFENVGAMPVYRSQQAYAGSLYYQNSPTFPLFQPNGSENQLIIPSNSDINGSYNFHLWWNSSATTGNVEWTLEGFTAEQGSGVAVSPIVFGVQADNVGSIAGERVHTVISLDFVTPGFIAGEPMSINLRISDTTTISGETVNLFVAGFEYALI